MAHCCNVSVIVFPKHRWLRCLNLICHLQRLHLFGATSSNHFAGNFCNRWDNTTIPLFIGMKKSLLYYVGVTPRPSGSWIVSLTHTHSRHTIIRLYNICFCIIKYVFSPDNSDIDEFIFVRNEKNKLEEVKMVFRLPFHFDLFAWMCVLCVRVSVVFVRYLFCWCDSGVGKVVQ